MHRRAKDGIGLIDEGVTAVELTAVSVRIGWVKGERGWEFRTPYDLPRTYYRAPKQALAANCPWIGDRNRKKRSKLDIDCRCGCQCDSETGAYPGDENKEAVPTAIALSIEYPHFTNDPNGGVVHKSCGWHPKDEPTTAGWPRGYTIHMATDLPPDRPNVEDEQTPQKYAPLCCEWCSAEVCSYRQEMTQSQGAPIPLQTTIPPPVHPPCEPTNHRETQHCFDLDRGSCDRGGCVAGLCSPTIEQTVRCMIEQYRDAASHGKANGKHSCDACVIYIRSANWQTTDEPARRGGLRKRTTETQGKAYRKPSRGAKNNQQTLADWMPWNKRNRGNATKPSSPKGSASWDEYDPAGHEARNKNWEPYEWTNNGFERPEDAGLSENECKAIRHASKIYCGEWRPRGAVRDYEQGMIQAAWVARLKAGGTEVNRATAGLRAI